MRAHLDLLAAELAVTGQQIGIIVGLVLAAVLLAFLLLFLVYIGTLLFLGEWLLGSMAWGILDGVLLTIAFVVPIGLDLAGGSVRAWARGLVVGLVFAALLGVVLATNVVRDAAVRSGHDLAPRLALDPAALPTLLGLVVGAVILAVVAIALTLRGAEAKRSGRRLALGGLLGGVAGALLGAILASVTFHFRAAVAVALTLGLLTWLVAAVVLAARRGFDPQRRYERLVPRESAAAFQQTKTFLRQQWRRQRAKLMGR